MLHACFVRSPHPHAKVVSIDIEAAKNAPGVAAVLTAADINPRCEPFVGVALHRPGHRSAPQSLLAADVAFWQGQPVALVAADSRAEAEDAAELVAIEWEPLPAVGDQLQAIAPGAPVIHASLGDNVAFDFTIEKGEPAKAFAEADFVIEEELRFERQTAMTLEARGLIADFNPGDGSLNVTHSHQSPFQMQHIFSKHLGIPEHLVRVAAPDVGGGFGMKLNIYSDEIATVVASMILGRPVKFCVDRLESFVSDAQARDHRIKCRIAVKKSGEIVAMEMDDLGAIGAFGMAHRFNVAEGMMAITATGTPYSFNNYKGRTRSVHVNKNLIGMYRGVGMPLAVRRDGAADRSRRGEARHRHGRVQAPRLPAEILPALRDARRTAAGDGVVPRMPRQARRADGLRRASQGTAASYASAASTAASASPPSASRPPMARPITARRALRSPPRTAAPYGSIRPAPCVASPA